MQTETFYEDLIGKSLNEFKDNCDRGWFVGKNLDKQNSSSISYKDTLGNIDTSNSFYYSKIRNKYKNLLKNIEKKSLIYLLNFYQKDNFEQKQISIKESKVLAIEGFKSVITKPIDIVESIIMYCKSERVIYVFRVEKYRSLIPIEFENYLKSNLNISNIVYVDVITNGYDYTFNRSDQTSNGTIIRQEETMSLDHFFAKYISEDEYLKLLKYTDIFAEKAKEMFNFDVVKPLNEEVIHDYCGNIENTLLKWGFKKYFNSLSKEEYDTMELNFFDRKLYKALTGHSSFAESFITAEWLYNSLGKIKNIDYTAIAMDYLKSIEQFLECYISIVADKYEQTKDDYLCIYNPNYRNNKLGRYCKLNKTNYAQIKNDLTIGQYIRFFNDDYTAEGKKHSAVFERNFSEETIKNFNAIINNIAKQRNQYFHKINITDRLIVDEIRELTLETFFIFFGALKLDDKDFAKLGILEDDIDDFQMLCFYIDNVAKSQEDDIRFNDIVYEFYFDKDKTSPVLARVCTEFKIENNKKVFDSVNFKGFGPNCQKSYTKMDVPEYILQIKSHFSSSETIEEKVIFEKGKFNTIHN